MSPFGTCQRLFHDEPCMDPTTRRICSDSPQYPIRFLVDPLETFSRLSADRMFPPMMVVRGGEQYNTDIPD